MREIKFRAWIKEEKDLLSWEDLQAEEFWDALHKKTKLEYILMQYTGLKDKNGKEIYEGDILKKITSHYATPPSYEEFITVSWCPKISGWNIRKTNLKQIIGNIYENSELL